MDTQYSCTIANFACIYAQILDLNDDTEAGRVGVCAVNMFQYLNNNTHYVCHTPHVAHPCSYVLGLTKFISCCSLKNGASGRSLFFFLIK